MDNLRENFPPRLHGSSACVGGLAKPQPLSERILTASKRMSIGQLLSHNKGLQSSSSEVMEHNISISNTLGANLSSVPNTVNENHESMKSPGETANNLYNQGAIAWNEIRKEWVGDQSKRSHRTPREPTISWTTSYEDLLSTNQPFAQPIPLSEMVEFLVDTWDDDGLYD
ncbi:hypothetical protein Cni_G18604 [Canna indica]|uniref:Gag1-like clamp domain-containing protein n=1 Tax=Canna indica TaxID=4628 RepID=A0AAQ3KQ05_9LILI|nr:hypothetical protein Cni_G18604 [Canna indica]